MRRTNGRVRNYCWRKKMKKGKKIEGVGWVLKK